MESSSNPINGARQGGTYRSFTTVRGRALNFGALGIALVVGMYLCGFVGFAPAPSSGPTHIAALEKSLPKAAAFLGYNVTFAETGLPADTNWSVDFDSVVKYSGTSFESARITFPEILNGSYGFNIPKVAGWDAKPVSGTTNVTGKTALTNITFSLPPGEYSVSFTESGLARGAAWGVTFNGTYYPAPTHGAFTIEPLTNRTYSWNTSEVGGLIPHPASGSMVLSGKDLSQEINFTEPKGQYSVEFEEYSHTFVTWSVFFNGTTYPVTGLGVTVDHVLNGSYNYSVKVPTGYTASPTGGPLTVNGANILQYINITATPGEYDVAFVGSGAPANWTMTFAGTGYTADTFGLVEISGVKNGTYAYVITQPAGYIVNPTTGSVTVDGASLEVEVNFTAVTAGDYVVTFSGTGLPAGALWSVTYDSTTVASAGTSIQFQAPDGTWTFSVTAPAGYVAVPASGSIPVSGSAPPTEVIHFEPTYSVTFTETGLPSGTNWSVVFNGTQTQFALVPSIVFMGIPNGTYSYTVGMVGRYAASSPSGSVPVTGGDASQPVTFAFVNPTYAVSFVPSGLPSGTNWSVTLGTSTSYSAAGGSIVFEKSNDSYSFSVGHLAGYSVSPSTGSVTVSGSAVTKTITFTAVVPEYTVTFTESGLSQNTNWSVILNGSLAYGTTQTLTFSIENGSYSFSVPVVKGYTASPTSGTLTVSGGASKTISYTATSSGNQNNNTGSGSTSTYLYIGIGAGVAVVAVVAALVLMRKKPAPPPQGEYPQYPPQA